MYPEMQQVLQLDIVCVVVMAELRKAKRCGPALMRSDPFVGKIQIRRKAGKGSEPSEPRTRGKRCAQFTTRTVDGHESVVMYKDCGEESSAGMMVQALNWNYCADTLSDSGTLATQDVTASCVFVRAGRVGE